MEQITSRANPSVRLVRMLLARRAARHRERAFVAEGLRSIESLLDSGLAPRMLLLDAERPELAPEALVQMAAERGARLLAVDSKLFREISDVETPQPALAVFEMPAEAGRLDAELVLCLDQVSDPGNLGSILRSASAAGVGQVALLPATVDPYNPKVVRASAGILGRLPLKSVRSAVDLRQAAQDADAAIVLADGRGKVRYECFDWNRRLFLVVGGEASGASAELREYATESVRIEMRPGVESINVAAAAAVLLFEARRQRAAT